MLQVANIQAAQQLARPRRRYGICALGPGAQMRFFVRQALQLQGGVGGPLQVCIWAVSPPVVEEARYRLEKVRNQCDEETGGEGKAEAEDTQRCVGFASDFLGLKSKLVSSGEWKLCVYLPITFEDRA